MGRPNKRAAHMRQRRLNETNEEREKRLSQQRKSTSRAISKETCKERKNRLSKMRLYMKKKLNREKSEERSHLLGLINDRLSNETEEQRAHRRLSVIHDRLSKETEEQRANRLSLIHDRLSQGTRYKDNMSTWTKEETLGLVKLYKSHPHLWNKNSDLYHNRQAQEGALLSIMSKMGSNKFKSAKDVRQKLNTLRDTYQQAFKKKARFETEGIPYQPTLCWFYEFPEIMGANSCEPVKQEPDSDDNMSDGNVLEYSEPTSTSNAMTSEYIETIPEENTQYVVSRVSPQATINVAPIPFRRIKLEEHDQDSAGPSHGMRRQEKETVKNELHMYANNIEEQLRKLEENEDKEHMSTSTWTEEETYKLVKLYKAHPGLWNKTLDVYTIKEAREGALLSIMSKMGSNKFKSTQEVRDKLNSLRTKYHEYLKKKAKSERKGCPYRRTLSWSDDFREIVNAGRIDTVKQEPDSDNIRNSEYSEPTSTSNATTSEYIETMPDEENTQYVLSQVTPQATINIAPIQLKRIKLEEHDKDSAGPSHDMRKQVKEKVNDEFQMFADNIAEQLRKLPLDRALKIQLAIQSIVAEERTQFYRKSMSKAHK